MSVLTDLIYGRSHAVAGLTEGAVNDAIAKYGADHPIAFPDTAYFFPTIYAATGVKVKTLGDLPACVGVLKSLITDQEDLGQALNAGLATAVGAEILEGLKFAEPKDAYEQAAVPGIGFVPDPIIRSLGVPLVTGDIPGVAVVLGKAENGEDVAKVVKDFSSTPRSAFPRSSIPSVRSTMSSFPQAQAQSRWASRSWSISTSAKIRFRAHWSPALTTMRRSRSLWSCAASRSSPRSCPSPSRSQLHSRARSSARPT